MYSGKNPAGISKMSRGLRKPDILGIRVEGDRIVFELLEVTTVGQADSTIIEDLESKKGILEEVVIPNIVKDIANYQLASMVSIGPTNIEVVYSDWKPKEFQLIVPLVPNMRTGKYEWICYKPTFSIKPPKGLNGLILYEIHSVGNEALVPKKVLKKIAEDIKRIMGETTFDIRLGLFLTDYMKAEKEAVKELLIPISFGLAIAAVIVAGVYLLPRWREALQRRAYSWKDKL